MERDKKGKFVKEVRSLNTKEDFSRVRIGSRLKLRKDIEAGNYNGVLYITEMGEGGLIKEVISIDEVNKTFCVRGSRPTWDYTMEMFESFVVDNPVEAEVSEKEMKRINKGIKRTRNNIVQVDRSSEQEAVSKYSAIVEWLFTHDGFYPNKQSWRIALLRKLRVELGIQLIEEKV